MTLTVCNTIGNTRRTNVKDVLGTTGTMEKFAEENKEFFDNYLMLDRDAWATDEAHARKYGSVLCLTFDAAGEYKYETKFSVDEYLRDPRRYNQERSNLQIPRRGDLPNPDVAYKGYLTAAIIPISNATDRQKAQFQTVSQFMVSMAEEWLRRVGLSMDTASAMRQQLANPPVAAEPAELQVTEEMVASSAVINEALAGVAEEPAVQTG